MTADKGSMQAGRTPAMRFGTLGALRQLSGWRISVNGINEREVS